MKIDKKFWWAVGILVLIVAIVGVYFLTKGSAVNTIGNSIPPPPALPK
jgi:hypothetical protein